MAKTKAKKVRVVKKYTEDELNTAKYAAYDNGYAAGIEKASPSISDSECEHIGNMLRALGQMGDSMSHALRYVIEGK